MLKITAEQLTQNPEFAEIARSTQEGSFFVTDFIRKILLVEGDEDYQYVENVNSAQPEPGHHIVSFKWNGDYEGVVVYEVFVVSDK